MTASAQRPVGRGPHRPFPLFLLFSKMSLLGFGGVLPWAHRILVEHQHLLDEEEFAELLAFAQMLPGPTICNLAVIVGHRNAGLRGGTAALAGMVVAPFIIVLLLGIAYQRASDLVLVQQALAGMSAVAAGLIIGIGIKMLRLLSGSWIRLFIAALVFVAVAVMHWPLLAVLGLALPLALIINYRTGRGTQ